MELIHTPHGPRIHVPLDLRRQSGRKQIIIPSEPDENVGVPIEQIADESSNRDALILIIARSLRWKRLLDEGKYASVSAMAKALGINRWYMARLLRISLLAPDIIEAIVDGRGPDGISIEKLRQVLPMLWSEQRTLLGV